MEKQEYLRHGNGVVGSMIDVAAICFFGRGPELTLTSAIFILITRTVVGVLGVIRNQNRSRCCRDNPFLILKIKTNRSLLALS